MTDLVENLRARSDVMPFLPTRYVEDSSESTPSTPATSFLRETPRSPPTLRRRAQRNEPIISSRCPCAGQDLFYPSRALSRIPKDEFFLATPSELEEKRNPVPLPRDRLFLPIVTGDGGAKRREVGKEKESIEEESPCGLADLKQEQPYPTWTKNALFAPIKHDDHSDDDHHMMCLTSSRVSLKPRSRASELCFVN